MSTSGKEPVSGSQRPIRLLPASSGNSCPTRPPRVIFNLALKVGAAPGAVGGALGGGGRNSPVGSSAEGAGAGAASAATALACSPWTLAGSGTVLVASGAGARTAAASDPLAPLS